MYLARISMVLSGSHGLWLAFLDKNCSPLVFMTMLWLTRITSCMSD